MATLSELLTELKARTDYIKGMELKGWGASLTPERQSNDEFQGALLKMLEDNIAPIIDLAGSIDLGDLPEGVKLQFSKAETN